MDSNNIFVRISYRTKDKENSQLNRVEDNIPVETKTKVRNCPINSNKYMICGGIYNRKGGTIFFSAKNLKEVSEVTEGKRAFVKDSLIKYDVFIVPKALGCR